MGHEQAKSPIHKVRALINAVDKRILRLLSPFRSHPIFFVLSDSGGWSPVAYRVLHFGSGGGRKE
jgi:hypothetical protein